MPTTATWGSPAQCSRIQETRSVSGIDSWLAAITTTVTRAQESAAERIRKWWPECGG